MSESPKSRVHPSVIAVLIVITGTIIIAFMIYGNSPPPQPTAFSTWTIPPTATNTNIPLFTETVPPGEPTSTPAQETPTPEPAFDLTPTHVTVTSQAAEHPTLSLDEQFEQVDVELKRALQGNIKYTTPSTLKLKEAFTVELRLNASLSANELATQIVENSGLVTSTAEPGKLLTTGGGEVKVVGSEVEITPLMKAVLLAEDPQAFDIQPLHDNEVQSVGKNTTTTWKWLITARKAGTQKLIIVIYRQLKVDGEAEWRDVETYRADITVNVTFVQWLESLDWKWIAGILITLLIIPGFWRWYDQRKRKTEQSEKPKPGKKKAR